jgi:hypothetical protein
MKQNFCLRIIFSSKKQFGSCKQATFGKSYIHVYVRTTINLPLPNITLVNLIFTGLHKCMFLINFVFLYFQILMNRDPTTVFTKLLLKCPCDKQPPTIYSHVCADIGKINDCKLEQRVLPNTLINRCFSRVTV